MEEINKPTLNTLCALSTKSEKSQPYMFWFGAGPGTFQYWVFIFRSKINLCFPRNYFGKFLYKFFSGSQLNL